MLTWLQLGRIVRACWAGVTPAAQGADMEEAALGHIASGAVEVVADGTTSLVQDGSAFFIYAFGNGKTDRRCRCHLFGGMGAGRAADDK